MITNSTALKSNVRRRAADTNMGESPIRADGRGDGAHCLSATVESARNANTYTGNRAYAHRPRDFKEMIDKSIEKPILVKYDEAARRSAGPPPTPHNAAPEEASATIGTKAGDSSEMEREVVGI